MKKQSNIIWHKVSEKLPNKKTRYAGRYEVQVLGFDEDEYKDSGSYTPCHVIFNFKNMPKRPELGIYPNSFVQLASSHDGAIWYPAEITHWAELPEGPKV